MILTSLMRLNKSLDEGIEIEEEELQREKNIRYTLTTKYSDGLMRSTLRISDKSGI